MAAGDNNAPSMVVRPIPDPTTLTNELVEKATSALREKLEVRLDAMEEAWKEAGTTITRHADIAAKNVSDLTESKIESLKQLHEEKFVGVGTRFTELGTRLTQSDTYKQTALDAALKAAQTLVDLQNDNTKDSITKTEQLFTKQVDGLTTVIDDMKDRLTVIEARGQGRGDIWGYVIGAAGVIYALVMTFEAFVGHR
jgi:hypothetical protein